jgi:hypothetical protein
MSVDGILDTFHVPAYSLAIVGPLGLPTVRSRNGIDQRARWRHSSEAGEARNRGFFPSVPALIYFEPNRFFAAKTPVVELIARVELQTQQSVRTLVGTVGWAAVGVLLAGPIGALLGGLFGHRREQVCFVAHFRDGRSFLATTALRERLTPTPRKA